jgi:transcriptional regulator GlxA family with amidase domain
MFIAHNVVSPGSMPLTRKLGLRFYASKDVDPRIPAISRHTVFFVYPGFVLLDLSGPLEAFSLAETVVPGSYRFTVVSTDGGQIASSSGLKVMTEKTSDQSLDTLVVVGDMALPRNSFARSSVDYICDASLVARRIASVCTGTFLLAAGGLLDGRRATTHWRFAAKLQALYPAVSVDGDRIFINDDGMWTSAGMTAGIDMALALIEEDLGTETARTVARMMVVYYRRPGGQDQYSSLLELEPDSDRIRNSLYFAREHLADRLSVETLAEAAHLSVRQFSRVFLASTGVTPAKAIERLRVETARPRIEDGYATLDAIAQEVGFNDPERMCESFVRVLGQTPQELRRLARAWRAAGDPATADDRRAGSAMT